MRIENLVVNRDAGKSEFGDFLCFETLTLCPIDTRCLIPELLGQDDVQWLNSYHATVRERLAPLLRTKPWPGSRHALRPFDGEGQ